MLSILAALGLVLLLLFLTKLKEIKEFYVIVAKVNPTVKELPGPPSSMGVNIHQLFGTTEQIFKVLRQWSLEYYPIYETHVGYMAAAHIVNPHDFEMIMSNMKHISKGHIYEMLHNWLGTGLLTSEGDKWQQRRKILTPSFHFNILQDFIEIFQEETKALVEVFKRECRKPYIPINDFISDFALNTIGETAMGTSINTQTDSGRKYKKAIYDIGKLYVYRFTHPWLLHKFLYIFAPQFYKEHVTVRTLHTFTNDVITKREKDFKLQDTYSRKKRLAMLDLLLSAKREENLIDDAGIREEVDTFMFEGHDTTSVAICHILLVLASHPNIQEQIYDEIREILPDNTKPTYNTLQELKFMERCIKEGLRLYPSVPFIARILGEDIVTHSGHKLKAGSEIYMHIYDIHHNPDIYPDPEKFDPDRFLPENCQNRHNFAYVPFSAGPRNCIGQKFAMLEIKTVLCGILSEFILEPVDTPESVTFMADIVLRTTQSIKIKFVPRSH